MTIIVRNKIYAILSGDLINVVIFRWDKANELLNEMHTNRVSNIHQVIGQMIKGDFDDANSWQMVEYAFDKLNSEGCGLGIRFYNTILEALWCLDQKERAARVLSEATKRGLYPELYRRNKLIWSVNVHRYCDFFSSFCFLFVMSLYHVICVVLPVSYFGSFRMWPGAACTAISVWLNNMQESLTGGEELPQLATAVVV